MFATALAPVAFLVGLSFQAFSVDPAEPTDEAGVGVAAAQLYWGDVDGDGYPDGLAVSSGAGRLLWNRGDGSFEDVTDASGLSETGGVSWALWGDLDADTDLDLVLGGVDGTVSLWRNEGGALFQPLPASGGLEELSGVQAAGWVDLDQDATPDLHLEARTGHYVMRNQGEGRFVPVGLEVATGRVLTSGFLDSATGAATGMDGTAGRAGGGVSGSFDPAIPEPLIGASGGDSTVASGGTVGPVAGTAACVLSVRDQATGSCIGVSSNATLGFLYPMSQDLFVASNGDVGMGTTSPASELHLLSNQPDIRLQDDSDPSSSTQLIDASPTQFLIRKTAAAEAFVDIDPLPASGLSSKLRVFRGTNTVGEKAVEFFKGDGGTTRHATIGVDGEDSFFGLGGGNVGIGTATPTEMLDVNGTARMWAVELQQNGETAFSELVDGGPTQLAIRKYASANALVDINPLPVSGDSAKLRVFRETNTVGAKAVEFFKGDGGTTRHAQIGVDGEDSYFAVGGGNVGIGTASPSASLHVEGTARVKVLEITGADLVEAFDTNEAGYEPGTVVSIDPETPGLLVASAQPYDHKVAGVVSGAGGIPHGIYLGKDSSVDGDTPVAMTGRVYVKCSAENGAVRPGDLLTTAALEGYAMRASDPDRWPGAVIGKAMSPLDEGAGLVLVLVNLQ